jgi:toxin-antitoxin system PIN domain toxin
MATHLLDVNALVALLWEDHVFHEKMARWSAGHGQDGWASCAITQSGFVRVMMQPALAQHGRTLSELAEVLAQSSASSSHRLLPLDFSFADVVACCTGGLVGHRQITDAYLLTAAMRAGMKLLTFDSGIGALLGSSAERNAHITLLH